MSYLDDGDVVLWCGDALDVLRGLPSGSVDCIVTSPPYYGLRDYGVPGQIGLEPTPEAWVASLVAVFAEARRVLADHGVMFVNVGDSYVSTSTYSAPRTMHVENGWKQDDRRPACYYSPGAPGREPGHPVASADGLSSAQPAPLKPKDLVGAPWRLAFALQADGWWLRSAITWCKPSPMPESVTDRPTQATEMVFLLAKRARYWYDQEATREPANGDHPRTPGPRRLGVPGQTDHSGARPAEPPTSRNQRNWWVIPSQAFPDAHFAVMPEELVRRCIAAGCPEGGTVLDPFVGSGTTALVARRMGRRCVGIDLSPEYLALAARRLQQLSLLA